LQRKPVGAPAKATPAKAAAKDNAKEVKKETPKKDSKEPTASSPTKSKKVNVYTSVEKQKGAAIPIDVTFEGDVSEAKVCSGSSFWKVAS